MGKDLGDYPPGCIGRDRKTDSLGHGNDGRIDAHHLAGGINQRPAGIPRVERRCVLDDIFDQPPLGASQGPSQGTDHAR